MNAAHEVAVFADLAAIEKTLIEDPTGERARGIHGYFEAHVVASTTRLQAELTDHERQTTLQLVEGMKASQRIVRATWEALHARPLAG